jgi:hypothetical protein
VVTFVESQVTKASKGQSDSSSLGVANVDRQKSKFRIIAWPAWGLVAANVIPAVDPHISPAMSTLAVGAGTASVLAWVIRDCQRPVSQIWESGREYGRREAILEGDRWERVVSLDAERQARREFDERRTGSR